MLIDASSLIAAQGPLGLVSMAVAVDCLLGMVTMVMVDTMRGGSMVVAVASMQTKQVQLGN